MTASPRRWVIDDPQHGASQGADLLTVNHLLKGHDMSETTHDYWWALQAYNTQAQYGYGTRNQAQQWADHLNRGREANLYAPEMCDSQQSDRLDAGDEGVDLADELAAIAKAKK